MKIFLRLIKLIVVPLLIAIGIYSFIRFVWIPNSEEEKEFKVNPDKMSQDSENATVVSESDETNSNEATVKRTESEESNSEEGKTDEVSAKKTGGKNENFGAVFSIYYFCGATFCNMSKRVLLK